MPIYEHYCADCHTVYSFFSSSVTDRRPSCPQCGRAELPRKPSRFAAIGAREEGGGEEDEILGQVDEARLEGAMEAMMTEMEGVDPEAEDPRQVGRMLRRFSELSGLELGESMEAAMARMEAGEDPEQVEADLGLDEAEDAELFKVRKLLRERARRPRVDETLYPL